MNYVQPVLWVAVIASALASVQVVQWHRDLMQMWQKTDQERQMLQQEYSRLVLEKSTLMANGRIDSEARKRLNMKDPDHTQVFQ